MRIFFLLIFTITSFGCSTVEQSPQDTRVKDFNAILGKEKAKALNEAVDSFEEFLKVNFPNKKDYEERTLTFLKRLDTAYANGTIAAFDSSMTLNTERNRRVYEMFEESGLRREIWLWGYEEYVPKHDISELTDIKSSYTFPKSYSPMYIKTDSELIKEAKELSEMEGYNYETMLKALKAKRENRKKSLYTNEYGDFIYGLIKHAEDSSFTKNYATFQLEMSVSSAVLLKSLIEFNSTKIDLSDPFIKRIIVAELYFPMIHYHFERNK